jgi:hypothetical protein
MDNPFDLDNHTAYLHWRDTKRTCHPKQAEDLIVDVADPRHLSQAERHRLLALCTSANMAIYRSPVVAEDKAIPRLLAARLGLRRLDGNWLADDDGISPIAVAAGGGDRPAFIPYTNRPIKWHADGYYHPPSRQILAMVLHCVRRAQSGGESAIMDHEMAYIALREANPDWVRALMQPDAMTIPERTDEDGIARAEQTGPVFSVDSASGALHMRYTARTRSIVWKDDAPTRAAVAFLEQLLASDDSNVFRLTLQPGMGLVCNNVLHDRSGFVDDPAQPRLLYRARYLDRIQGELPMKSASSPREICLSSY